MSGVYKTLPRPLSLVSGSLPPHKQSGTQGMDTRLSLTAMTQSSFLGASLQTNPLGALVASMTSGVVKM